VDFVDGIDVGGSSKIDILGQGSVDNFISGRRHNLFQTSIDNIELSGSFKKSLAIESLFREASCFDDYVKQILLSLFLPFTLHTSGPDVIKVLQPFEVAYSHTSSVAENIGQKLDAFVDEDSFAFHSGRAVGGFNDELGFKSMGVVNIDGTFESSGNEEVTE
jgi:hypothetical protein